MNDETLIWKGSPSQWLNIGHFMIALVVAAGVIWGGIHFPPVWALMILPAGYAGWFWIFVRARKFELTTQRLRVYEGVLNQRIHEVELYRVKDTIIERPLWMRIAGLSNIVLETSERSVLHLVLHAIPDGAELREQIRTEVERVRDSKRVREMDFEDHSATNPTGIDQISDVHSDGDMSSGDLSHHG